MVSVISGFTLASVISIGAAATEGLELLENIGSYHGELKVYFAKKPTTEDLLRRQELGENLGRASGVKFLKEKPIKLSASRSALIGVEDPSASFEIDSLTGNFLFNGGMKKYRKEEATKDLPRNNDAVDISSRTLEKYGLNVNTTQMELSHVGGLNMAVADGAGNTTIFEKLRAVRYKRVLSDLSVQGDTRIVMHLGEGGDLAGIVYQWPNIERVLTLKPEHLQKPVLIRERALKVIDKVTVNEKVKKSRLTRASLVLYDDGRGVMEPAYHFVVERHFDYDDRELVMIPYDFYIPTTINPLAFYPFMETLERRPEDGKDEGEVKNGPDE